MVIYVEPALSMMISDVQGLPRHLQSQKIAAEKKLIASRELEMKDFTHFTVWKRLYFQLQNVHVNELDFVKASASHDILIKRCAYLGLTYMESPRYGLLMTNTVAKDLADPVMFNDAIAFLCNYNDAGGKLLEVSIDIKDPPAIEKYHSKVLVAQGRCNSGLRFSLSSKSETALLTKIQIILDNQLADSLTQNDILYARDRIYGTKCHLLTVKLLQLYAVLHHAGKLPIDEKLFAHLRSLIVRQTSKAVKQIEMGISLECCKLLMVSGNFCERAEGFVFRLINSENPNSRYLGFNFAIKYGIFNELVVERIIKLGVHNEFYLGTLIAFIDKFNYKRIYRQHEEIMHYVLKDTIDPARARYVSRMLLARIAELSDAEFLCKVLYENPAIYQTMRSKCLLPNDRIGPLFRAVMEKNDMEHFQLIYDTMPPKIYDNAVVASIAHRHTAILTEGRADSTKLDLLEALIDVLCVYGDKSENRTIILRALENVYLKEHHSERYAVLLHGVLLFNWILEEKYIHVNGAVFMKCT